MIDDENKVGWHRLAEEAINNGYQQVVQQGFTIFMDGVMAKDPDPDKRLLTLLTSARSCRNTALTLLDTLLPPKP